MAPKILYFFSCYVKINCTFNRIKFRLENTMDSSQISLGVLLRELNCFSLDSIDDRILIQKKIYLLMKNQNVSLPYSYNWYLHGPYCPLLTSHCYEIIPILKEEIKPFSLNDYYKPMIDKINNYECNKPTGLTSAKWYELLASILYLNLEFGFFGIKEKSDLKQKLNELKPGQFDDKDIDAAIFLILNKS